MRFSRSLSSPSKGSLGFSAVSLAKEAIYH
jgi:hypothetical protein